MGLEIVPLPVRGMVLLQGTRTYALPPDLEEDDPLDIALLESLCDHFLLPREDFGLNSRQDD